jgi:endonuclease YncB( thermonuclease family)
VPLRICAYGLLIVALIVAALLVYRVVTDASSSPGPVVSPPVEEEIPEPVGAIPRVDEVKAVITRVYDGDTITVDIPGWPPVVGKSIGIRVWGIDTPERKDQRPHIKEMAVAARELVEAKAKATGGRVTLKDVARDKYFRLLARVYIGGHEIAAELKAAGLAKEYYGETKVPWGEKDYQEWKRR